MTRKWKILLACVVIVAVACAAAWYLLPRPAVGGDYEAQYINVGETLENITGQIDQNTCNALNDLLRQAERRGYRRNVFPRQLREDTVQLLPSNMAYPIYRAESRERFEQLLREDKLHLTKKKR